MGVARTAIIAAIGPWRRNQSPSTSGELPCPVCSERGEKGKLGYVRASTNGHIHAKCSTFNCVGWME